MNYQNDAGAPNRHQSYPGAGVGGGFVGSAGIIGGATTPVVCSQIEQRLMDLDQANKMLNEVLSGFLDKLQPVLQPVLIPQSKPDANAQATPPKPIASPLAERLDSYLSEHRYLTGLLRDLFDRLAL